MPMIIWPWHPSWMSVPKCLSIALTQYCIGRHCTCNFGLLSVRHQGDQRRQVGPMCRAAAFVYAVDTWQALAQRLELQPVRCDSLDHHTEVQCQVKLQTQQPDWRAPWCSPVHPTRTMNARSAFEWLCVSSSACRTASGQAMADIHPAVHTVLRLSAHHLKPKQSSCSRRARLVTGRLGTQ